MFEQKRCLGWPIKNIQSVVSVYCCGFRLRFCVIRLRFWSTVRITIYWLFERPKNQTYFFLFNRWFRFCFKCRISQFLLEVILKTNFEANFKALALKDVGDGMRRWLRIKVHSKMQHFKKGHYGQCDQIKVTKFL